MKKIILLSSERSGSNLLRTLLGKHTEISAPVPVHLYNNFKYHSYCYGDLSIKENVIELLNDVIVMVNHPHTDWGLDVTGLDLYEQSKPQSLSEVFDVIYSAKANQRSNNAYFCKCNDMYNHVGLMDELYEVSYIYLYRDPRDQAVSWLETPFHLHTAYDIAAKWTKEQARVRELEEGDLSCFKISYEDLIEDTELQMKRLLEFVGLEVQDACFTTNTENRESQNNALWSNLNKPIIKGNIKKYEKHLSAYQIEMVEGFCWEEMKWLGYELENLTRPRLNFIDEMLNNKLRERSIKAHENSREDSFATLLSKQRMMRGMRAKRML